MSKSPATTVKEQFGDKAKLVAALGPFTNDDLWVGRLNETKGLARVSNAKLLKLFNVLSVVKDKFGNRFKLVDAICEIEKRTKDEGYKKRLLSLSGSSPLRSLSFCGAPRRNRRAVQRARGPCLGQSGSGRYRVGQGEAGRQSGRRQGRASQEARRQREGREPQEEGVTRRA